jgi:hypothetical protein
MIKQVITGLFLLTSIEINAQIYFNYRFNYTDPAIWDGATTAIALNDGYVIVGGTGTLGNYFWHRLGLIKTDFNGNLLSIKTYGDSISEYYFGYPGCMIQVNDTSFIGVGSKNTYLSNWVLQEGLFIKFNKFFDTLFSKKYGDKVPPVDTAYQFQQIKLSGNNFIIAGGKMPYGLATKAILVKTDGSGNVIFEKSYGSWDYYEGSSVICTTDGGYALGGFLWYPLPPPNYTGDPVITKTDSSGNLQWMKNFGGPYPDNIAMLSNSIDGNIIIGTSYCDSIAGGGTHVAGNCYRKINIIKLDNSGTILWNKKYGKSEYFKTLTNIRTNTDGSIVSTGIMHHYFNDYGWILKTTENGDILWYREYAICEEEDSNNWLMDVIETSDNGYLACGNVYPMPPDTGSQDGWLLKVDSLGCEAPGECWVGQDEIWVKTFTPDKPFVVYPNPATDKITVEFHINPLGAEFGLYDLTGRQVLTDKIAPNRDLVELDIGKLKGGLYILKVIMPGRRPVMEKVVVE